MAHQLTDLKNGNYYVNPPMRFSCYHWTSRDGVAEHTTMFISVLEVSPNEWCAVPAQVTGHGGIDAQGFYHTGEFSTGLESAETLQDLLDKLER